MPTFRVTYDATLRCERTIEAANEEEAMDLVEEELEIDGLTDFDEVVNESYEVDGAYLMRRAADEIESE